MENVSPLHVFSFKDENYASCQSCMDSVLIIGLCAAQRLHYQGEPSGPCRRDRDRGLTVPRAFHVILKQDICFHLAAYFLYLEHLTVSHCFKFKRCVTV